MKKKYGSATKIAANIWNTLSKTTPPHIQSSSKESQESPLPLSSLIMALEPRFMFDGAAPATVDVLLDQHVGADASVDATTVDTSATDQGADLLNSLANTIIPPVANTETTESGQKSDQDIQTEKSGADKPADETRLELFETTDNSTSAITLPEDGESSDAIPTELTPAHAPPAGQGLHLLDTTESTLLSTVETTSGTASEGIEIAFIDSNLEDIQTLIDSIDPEVTIILLDGSTDGISQITDALNAAGDTVSAIHILGHGSSGSVSIGSTELSNDTLPEYSDELTSWQSYLSEDADILIYGCDVAEGDAGSSLITSLARITSADLAASTDLTGNADLGGDWVLEYTVGDIEASTITDALGSYSGLLDAPTTSDQAGTIAGEYAVNFNGWTFGFDDAEDGAGNITAITITELPDAADGVLTLNGDAVTVGTRVTEAQFVNLVFTPVNKSAEYTASFDFKVEDSSGELSTSATFTITVEAVNDAPVAVTDAITATEDTGIVVTDNLLTNDTDADTATADLTVTEIRLGETVGTGMQGSIGSALVGEYGAITVDADGTYTYTLDNNSEAVQALGVGETLTESFNYTMQDDGGSSSSAVLTVTIDGTNDAPVATSKVILISTSVPENSTDAENPGTAVSEFLQTISGASLVADVDTNDTTFGIAVYGSETTNGMTGTWQYQLSGSSDWTAFTPSVTAATLIPSDAVVRFVAADSAIDSQESGDATLKYYAWDGQLYAQTDTPDVSDGNRGENTAFSENGISAVIEITSRNDSPTLVQGDISLDEYTSVTVDATMLPVVDPDSSLEQIVYRVEAVPEKGGLFKNGIALSVGSLFTQQDIDNNIITYVCDDSAADLAADTTDTFKVSIRDGAGGVIGEDGETGDNPWATITVDIKDVNAQVGVGSASFSTVENTTAGDGVILLTTLLPSDADEDGSPDGYPLMMVESLPAEGSLQYWDGSAYVDFTDADLKGGSAEKSFTVAELEANPLQYAPSTTEPDVYGGSVSFAVYVNDGGRTDGSLAATEVSPTIEITVSPINDVPIVDNEVLQVTVDNEDEGSRTEVISGFAVNEVTDTSATNGSRLGIIDADSLDATQQVYTLKATPSEGSLSLNGNKLGTGSTFTQQDVIDGALTYTNSGTGFDDSFTYSLNDGDGGVVFGQFDIEITFPSGSSSSNIEVTLLEGETAVLSDTQVTGDSSYTVTTNVVYGELQLLTSGTWDVLAAADTFTQDDVDAGSLRYVNNGDIEPLAYVTQQEDVFTFTGSSSGEQTITFEVTPVNDTPSIDQTELSVDLSEGASDAAVPTTYDFTQANAVKLTVDNLQYVDAEVDQGVEDAANLSYVVDSSFAGGSKLLQWTGSAWIELSAGSRFTATDIENGNIAYWHNPDSEVRTDVLTVHLVDGGTNDDGTETSSASATVTFNLPNVNDAPVSSDGGFEVQEGGTQVLSTSILSVSDSDNTVSDFENDANGYYKIVDLPEHGSLYLNGNLVTADTQFSYSDLANGNLEYRHDGTEPDTYSYTDTFTYLASDADEEGNTATVSVNVLPVNDVPVVGNNTGVTVDEGSSDTVITAGMLSSFIDLDIDPDNTDTQVQYQITAGVEYGTLYLDKDGVITTLGVGGAFTLADIQAGYLKYDHDGSEPHLYGFEDSFGFTVSDASGMAEPSDVFVITIDPVDDEPTLVPTFFGEVAYQEDGDPVAIGSTVRFSDPDLNGTGDTPNLDGGTLVVSYAAGSLTLDDSDVLGIAADSGFTINATTGDITYGGVVIGSVDSTNDGTDGKSLSITFTAALTDSAVVQDLINALTFSNSDDANPTEGIRNLEIIYTDGDTSLASVTGTANVIVSQANDAPVMVNAADPYSVSVSEDFPSEVIPVGDLYNSNASDVDTSAKEGIAITSLDSGNGTWEYSTDSTNGTDGTWTVVDSASVSSALLLGSDDYIRFIPDDANATTGTFDYHAWDQTVGTAGGRGNLTDTGGTTAYSIVANTATVNTVDINDAPTLDAAETPTVTQIEDDVVPVGDVGTLVSTLVAGIDDVDNGAVDGIAITNNSNDYGIWYYSTDNGINWYKMGTTSIDESSALLLAADSNTRLYFKPNADYNGTQDTSLTFRAWDMTTGSNGSFGNTTTNGTTTAYSTESDYIRVVVDPVNDTPTISGDSTVVGTDEGTAVTLSSGGDIIVYDVEAFRDEGTGDTQGKVSVTIALDNDQTHGIIHIGDTTIVDSGNDTNIVTITGSLTEVNAALAAMTFTPGDDTGTTETITVTVNDLGNNGTTTTTAESATQTITVNNITPINDVPTSEAPSTVTATEDVVYAFTGDNALTVADVDSRDNDIEVSLSIPNGTLSLANVSGLTFMESTANDSSTMVIRGTVDELNTALAGLTYTPDTDDNTNNVDEANRTLTFEVDDLGYGKGDDADTTGLNAIKTVVIALTAVNDNPKITVTTPAQSVTEDTATAITDISVSDISDSADTDYADSTKPTLTITALHGTFSDSNAGNVTATVSADGKTITLVSSSTGAAALTEIDAYISAGNLKYTSVAGFSGVDQLSLVLDDQGNSGSGTSTNATGTIDLTVAGVNDAPVIEHMDNILVFVEDQADPVVLDESATFADEELSEYDNWENAVLTIKRDSVAAGNSDDVFSLTGSGDTGVNFSGEDIRIDTTVVGTFTNENGVLTVIFGNDTTTEQANTVLQAVTYRNDNDNPPSQVVVGYTINDGNDNTGDNPQGTGDDKEGTGFVTVNITANNDAPIIADIEDTSYTEDGVPIVLDSALSLSDPELSFLESSTGDWDAAVLTLQRSGTANAEDVFGVSGSGDTGVNFSGTDIRIGTTVVGTFTNTAGVLEITFTNDATTEQVETVAEAITYENTRDTQAGTEQEDIDLVWTINDGNTGDATTEGPQGLGGDKEATLTQTITFNGTNDAPVLADTVLTTSSITEDVGAPTSSDNGFLVSTLTGGISDVDNGALQGVAITDLDTSHGIWWYRTDGGVWTEITTDPTDAAALLLETDAELYLQMTDQDWNGEITDAVTFRAWDQSDGVVEGSIVDTSGANNGEATAFSADKDTLDITVDPINDAPVATGTATLAPVDEDTIDTSITGATVSTLVNANFSDVADTVVGGSIANDLAGVAIVNYTPNTDQGAWEYWDGDSWESVGTRTASTALLVEATDSLRFVPTDDFHGTPESLDVRLVEVGDVTINSGEILDLSNASSYGDATQYSSDTVQLSTSITSINDSPTTGAVTLAELTEGDSDPDGSAIDVLFVGTKFSDVTDDQTSAAGGNDSASVIQGLAVVGNTADATTEGIWQYSTNGTDWSDIATGTLSDTNALILTAATELRFLPTGDGNVDGESDYNGTPPALTVRVSDTTVASNQERQNLGTLDTTSQWSETTEIGVTVVARNDAPVIGTSATTTDDGSGNLTLTDSISITEDNGDNTGTASTAVNLLSDVNVSDLDFDLLGSDNFGGGTITVSSSDGFIEGDVISIADGSGTGSVRLVGDEVQYSADGSTWEAIGTVNEGTEIMTDSVFSSSAGWTASSDVRISDGVLTFSYTDGATVYREYTLNGETALSFSATVNADSDANSGHLELSFWDASGDQVGSTIEGPVITQTDTAQVTSLNGITVPDDAATVKVVFVQDNEVRYWAGYYGVSFSDPELVSSWTVDLNSNATVAAVEATLEALTYTSTSDNPTNYGTDTSRSYTVVLNDGENDGNADSRNGDYSLTSNSISGTIEWTATNDTPVLDLDDSADGTGYEVTYNEQETAISIVDSDVLITDLDDQNIESATIELTNIKTGDVLALDATDLPAGISIDSQDTDTIVLTGSATLAEYQTALQAIKFSNTSDAPNVENRVINIKVNDGDVNSSIAVSTILVTPVNDAPTVTLPAIADVTEDSFGYINGITVDDPDSGATGESATTTLTLTVDYGTLKFATTDLGTATVTSGNDTGEVVITGTVADINDLLAINNNLTYEGNNDFSGIETLDAVISDNGNVGSGGVLSDSATVEFTVAGDNDAPTLTTPSPLTVDEDTSGTLFGSFSIVDPDIVDYDMQVVVSVEHGTLDFETGFDTTGLTLVAGSYGSSTFTLEGTRETLNAALAKIEYAPTANYHGNDLLTIEVADLGDVNTEQGTNTGAAGTSINNIITETVAITVAPVNDQPTADDSSAIVIAVTEDVITSGATFDSLLSGRYDDLTDNQSANSGGNSATDLSYVAITGNAATAVQGTWQYSTNGTDWIPIPDSGLTDSSAIVLAADTQLRFYPAGDYQGEPGDLTVRVADDSATLTVSADETDLLDLNETANGDLDLQTGSWASDALIISPTVANVNDAPTVVTGEEVQTLVAVDEDISSGANSGSTVTDLFGSAFSDATDDTSGITGGTDVSTDFGGIAIVDNDVTADQGVWEYSTDGTTWTAIPSDVSDLNAVVLPTDAQLRFNPAENYNSTPGGLTVRMSDTPVVVDADADLSGLVGGSEHWSTAVLALNTSVAAVNDAPVAQADTGSVNEGATLTLNEANGVILSGSVVAGVDSDVDGDVLTVTGVTTGTAATAASIVTDGAANIDSSLLGAYGHLTLADDGSYIYVADTDAANELKAGANATDIFSYAITDNNGGTDFTTLTLTITGTNDAPTLSGTAIGNQTSNDADTMISVATAGAFDEVDTGDNLVYTVSSLPAGLTINATTGVISGTIDNSAGVSGPYSVTVTATDGSGESVDIDFTWTVSNPVPTATDNTAAINEDATSVAGNALTDGTPDSDPDGDDLEVSAIRTGAETGTGTSGMVGSDLLGAYGTLTLNDTGGYTYAVDNTNPAVQELGIGDDLTDTFTYTVSDGEGGTDTAELIVTINGINDAPTTTGISTQNSTDGEVVSFDTSSLFDDVDTTDSLDYTATGLPDGLTIDLDSGIISGTVDNSASVTGTYLVTVVATDESGVHVDAPFLWKVTNVAPVADNDTVDVTEDAGVNPASGNVLTNDADGVPDSDTIVVSAIRTGTETGSGTTGVVDGSTALTGSYGSLTIDAAGVYSYNLDNANTTVQALKEGDPLTETFTYTISDGEGGTDTAELTVNITGTNDAPVAVVDTDTAVEAGGIVNATAGTNPTGNVLTNDTDADAGDTKVVSAITGGTVDGNTVGTYGTLVLGNNGIYTYTVNNDLVAVQELAGTANTLTDTFTYTVKDSENATSETTLTITIEGANDNPVGVNDTAEAIEAGGVANGTDGTNPTGNVLTNDTDVDAGDTKTVSAVTGGIVDGNTIGTYGTLVLNNNGTYTYTVDNDNTTVEALSGPTDILTEDFTYTVQDTDGTTATAILTVTIKGSDDTSVISGDVIGAVTEGDVGDTVTDSGSISISDVDTDDSPTFADQVSTPGDNALGSFELISGTWTYTVDQNAVQYLDEGQEVTDTITYTATDGSTQQITITITGADDNPTATTIVAQDSEDGEAIAGVDVSSSFGVIDTLDSIVGYSATGLPDGLTIDVNGIISGTIAKDASQDGTSGAYTVTVIATDDDGNTASTDFTWTVTNPAPVTMDDGLTVIEDTAPTKVGNVLDNDTDSDGDTLTVTTIENSNNDAGVIDSTTALSGIYGVLRIGTNGAYSYTLDNDSAVVQALAVDETYTDVFTYKITDADGAVSNESTITITIEGTNDQPVLAIGDVIGSMNEGDGAASLSDSGALSFVDLDTTDTVTVSQTSNSDIAWDGGTLTSAQKTALVKGFTVDQDSWNYATNENLDFLALGETITFSYEVVATDDSGALNAASVAETVTITITGATDAPVIAVVDVAGDIIEGTTLSDTGSITFTDVDLTDLPLATE
ncbi:VCBS domain-containing protein, partial [Desulforhopalus vacuolatus]|uniref:VCBS domain-containing protein n=1 Tax=Desulforhopalus vacuolatus TaxID=40414 RepID=UPI001965940F